MAESGEEPLTWIGLHHSTRPKTLCTARLMPSWSRVVVRCSSWTWNSTNAASTTFLNFLLTPMDFPRSRKLRKVAKFATFRYVSSDTLRLGMPKNQRCVDSCKSIQSPLNPLNDAKLTCLPARARRVNWLSLAGA